MLLNTEVDFFDKSVREGDYDLDLGSDPKHICVPSMYLFLAVFLHDLFNLETYKLKFVLSFFFFPPTEDAGQ